MSSSELREFFLKVEEETTGDDFDDDPNYNPEEFFVDIAIGE